MKIPNSPAIGYIYYKTYHDPVNFMLMRQLAKKVHVVPLAIEEQVDLDLIRERTKHCTVIFNNAVFDPLTFESLQLSKTLEELGKKVINSTHSFFYKEDKWMFYLRCLERKLPTPRTYLIPRGTRFNQKYIRSIIRHGPVVLKSVYSDNGQAVERVRTFPEFKQKLKKLLRNDPRSPIIAQEYIPNGNRSYRVTLFGKKVKQGVVKIGKTWKQTGKEENETFHAIAVTPNLKKLSEKAAKAFRMDICGLDLIHTKGKWYIIEANSCPALDWIERDTSRLIRELAHFLLSKTLAT